MDNKYFDVARNLAKDSDQVKLVSEAEKCFNEVYDGNIEDMLSTEQMKKIFKTGASYGFLTGFCYVLSHFNSNNS